MFKTKYRVSRDLILSHYWSVQRWHPLWPFWAEYGNGLLRTKEEAIELIEILKKEYT